MSADVIVVGGGPAGLTAALLTARTGRSVVLLEAGSRLGGMAASTTVAGQRVDLGSHRLHPSAAGRTRALLEELLGDDLQVRPRRGRLRLDNTWVGFPLRVGDLLRRVPPSTGARIARDLALGPFRREHADDTYASVVTARLGPTVLDRFHGPYATKLWGVSPDQIAGELARRRIAMTGAGDVVRRLRRAASPEGRVFLYPRLGYGQIVDRLAEASADAGVDIRLRSRPTAIYGNCDTPVVGLEGGTEIATARVMWTAAPDGLLTAASARRYQSDDPLANKPSATPTHRGVVLVYVVLDTPRYTNFDAHYVPDPKVAFVRLSEPKNYRDGPDPADHTVLCAEMPATAGDPTWTATDADLGAIVTDGIARLGLPRPVVSTVSTIRLPRVYPLYDNAGAVDRAERVATAQSVPGVTLLGRQGLDVADNLHHVMDMAAAAVDCLRPEGGWDQAAWNLRRAAFDVHVVED